MDNLGHVIVGQPLKLSWEVNWDATVGSKALAIPEALRNEHNGTTELKGSR